MIGVTIPVISPVLRFVKKKIETVTEIEIEDSDSEDE